MLVLLGTWANLEALAARRATAVLGPSLLVVAASTGAALLLTGTLILGELGGGLAVALGVVWLLSIRKPDRSLSPGGITVLFATFAALLIEGHVYSGLPTAAYLFAIAPMAAWLGFVGPARRWAGWKSALLSTIATLVPAAMALGLAIAASPIVE